MEESEYFDSDNESDENFSMKGRLLPIKEQKIERTNSFRISKMLRKKTTIRITTEGLDEDKLQPKSAIEGEKKFERRYSSKNIPQFEKRESGISSKLSIYLFNLKLSKIISSLFIIISFVEILEKDKILIISFFFLKI